MIRIALLLALALSLHAADMVHQRVVLKGGEELVGWWCADQGVLYLDDGRRRLIDKPADQVERAEPVPAKGKAPDRKQFKQLPDLPFAAVTTANGQTVTGWWDEDSLSVVSSDGIISGLNPGSVTKVEPRQSPGAMHPSARRLLTVKAIEQD